MKIIDNLQKVAKPNSTITSISVIALQQFLRQNHFGALPAEFIEFLHFYNGIGHNGGAICGILDSKNINDISTINNTIIHPLHQDLVFLGYDDFDLLAYNQKHNVYQIIDKDDFEVLEEYTDFSSAAQYILKIEYD